MCSAPCASRDCTGVLPQCCRDSNVVCVYTEAKIFKAKYEECQEESKAGASGDAAEDDSDDDDL